MPTDAQRRNLASAHHAEVAQLEARLAWIEQKLFVSRWNGVIDSGAQTTWQIAPDWRHTVAKMVGHKFGEAIDAAISSTQEKP